MAKFDEHYVMPYKEMNELFVPENEIKYNILEITGIQIAAVCKNIINVDGRRLINDYKTSQLPRFK